MENAAAPSSFPEWLRSTLVHLRIKNTLHVAPVVLFAISQTANLSVFGAVSTVVILHLFIFPASVGYNAYFDRDTEPVGGIEAPPPVYESLYWVVTALEVIALGWALLINLPFAICIAITIAASRAYSSDKIRIKKRPVGGYVWVFFFQGAYSYIMVLLGVSADPGFVVDALMTPQVWLPALFSSFLVGGSYPLSQVYQFEEDRARGDITIAIVCGYTGTFVLALASLTLGYATVAAYFVLYSEIVHLVILTVLFQPPLLFVTWWFMQVRKDHGAADHKNAMRMAAISGLFGNICFIVIGVLNHTGS